MTYFHPENLNKSPRHTRVWIAFEIAHTMVDFGAAVCFVVGSVFFFWKSTELAATWLFLVGSILFAAKPTLRLAREVKLAALGDYADLKDKADGS